MSQKDQRRYPRYRCQGVAEMMRPGDKIALRAPLTDLSIGGFYIETMTPLPEGTKLQVALSIGRVEMYAQGVVETSHPNIGNGIAFTHITPPNEKALLSVIDAITTVSTGSVHDLQHAFSPEFEALLSVLERKSLITRQEVLSEFKSLTASKP